MNKSTQDFGIPVLTEIIDTPRRIAQNESAPDAALPASPAIDAGPIAASGQAPIEGWINEEWTQLEQKISERVLAQIMERVDTVLEQRIRDSLADVLQVAVEKLSNEIRAGLQQTLDTIITDAVAQEIDQLQFHKK